MAEPPPVGFDDLSAPDKHLVNEACARFEAALRAGHTPRPADELSAVPEALRPYMGGMAEIKKT